MKKSPILLAPSVAEARKRWGPGVGEHPGYAGAFTRDQAPGAPPNGTRVVKSVHKPGDSTPLGAEGRLLGSANDTLLGELMYFVEWDSVPGVAIGILARKVKTK